MNGILAVFILSLASTNAAPAPQEFYSQAYHTQSLYPSYNIQYQSLPFYPYSTLFPQSAYVQQPLPISSLCLNASEVQKIQADYQAAAEKILKANERNTVVTTKPDQKVDVPVKSFDATSQGSNSAINPFNDAGKTSSGVDCGKGADVQKGKDSLSAPSFSQSSADPIFGPEIGAKYEIHFSPESLSPTSQYFPQYSGYSAQPVASPALPYFSSYPGYSAQPAAFPAYSGIPTYPAYPVFGGSNPFAGFGSGGFELASSNGNKIEVSTSLPGTEISTTNPIKGGGTARSETSGEASSTALSGMSSESEDFIGAPPSIDGPGKLSKRKRGQRKNDKKSVA